MPHETTIPPGQIPACKMGLTTKIKAVKAFELAKEANKGAREARKTGEKALETANTALSLAQVNKNTLLWLPFAGALGASGLAELIRYLAPGVSAALSSLYRFL